ncbi:hypothetical protein D3C72_1403220 [compost metagenome]
MQGGAAVFAAQHFGPDGAFADGHVQLAARLCVRRAGIGFKHQFPAGPRRGGQADVDGRGGGVDAADGGWQLRIPAAQFRAADEELRRVGHVARLVAQQFGLARIELRLRQRVRPADLVPVGDVQGQRHDQAGRSRFLAQGAQALVGGRAAGAAFAAVELHQRRRLWPALHGAALAGHHLRHGRGHHSHAQYG